MSNDNEIPKVSLQTLVLLIQLVEKEISDLKKIYEEGTATQEDDIWRYDIDQAARNLKKVYTYEIENSKVIHFPSYDELIHKRQK